MHIFVTASSLIKMSSGTFNGYVEAIQIARLGKAISLKINLITPGGQRTALFIHNPPDWLCLTKAINGTYHEVATPDGTIRIIDTIAEDKNLRMANIHELTIEKILKIGTDLIVVEGKYSDGRIFSYTLRDPKLLGSMDKLPLSFLGLFVERDSIQTLVTIISKNEYNLVMRACEFSSQLSKIATEEPERKFLNGE